MSNKRYVVVLMLTMIAGLLGGALSSRMFAVQPVQAQQEVRQAAKTQKWEYCAVTAVSTHYRDNRDIGYYADIYYFNGSGIKGERIEVEYNREHFSTREIALAKAVAKLGEEGWEMIGGEPRYLGSSDSSLILYFKRLKQ